MITLKLTIEELRLLTSLAADQLFRNEFIDPKMPGFKPNPARLHMGKSLVARMRPMVDPGASKKPGILPKVAQSPGADGAGA